MKRIFKRAFVAAICMIALIAASCEQEKYDPNLTVAPGGGTVTTFKAYTLGSTTADNVYGRIVFYKYSASVTLVQMGLYNTSASSTYTAKIFSGTAIAGSTTTLENLDGVDGATGAFATYKYFTINKPGFFDQLSSYNANVKVMLNATTVASGDIGGNADPVSESE